MKKYFTLAVISMCIGLAGCSKKPNSIITIRNDANSVIVQAKIIVCRQTLIAKDLKHGQLQSLNFAATGDSGYKVEVDFADGRKINKELGYVTSMTIFDDLLIVDTNDIILQRISVK
jgi:hypothetical protein